MSYTESKGTHQLKEIPFSKKLEMNGRFSKAIFSDVCYLVILKWYVIWKYERFYLVRVIGWALRTL